MNEIFNLNKTFVFVFLYVHLQFMSNLINLSLIL